MNREDDQAREMLLTLVICEAAFGAAAVASEDLH